MPEPKNPWETIYIVNTKNYILPKDKRYVQVTLNMPLNTYLKTLKPQIEAPHLHNRRSEDPK